MLAGLCLLTLLLAQLSPAGAGITEGYPQIHQPSNTTNRFFSHGDKVVCPSAEGCRVIVWGRATEGGSGAPADVTNPTKGAEVISTTSNFKAFAVLKANGAVSVWGDPAYGGADAPVDVTTPAAGSEVVAVATTSRAFAALKANGAVSVWGDPAYAGAEAPTDVTNPTPGAEVISISSTGYAFAALKANGTVSVWGDPSKGGSGAPNDVIYPSSGAEVALIASTNYAFAALKVNGAVSVWGDPSYGGSGTAEDVTNPTPGADVIAIASTFFAFAALKANGAVAVWGSSKSGGSGAPDDVTNPSSGAEVVLIAATSSAFAALKANGAVSVWGNEGGSSPPASVTSPTPGKEVVSIASTQVAFAALKANGAVATWGSQVNGDSGVPPDVANPAPGAEVVSIASNYFAFAALKANGAVSVWGSATAGGSGAPVDVTDPPSGAEIVAITSGAYAFTALKKNGAVSVWGDANNGADPNNVPSDVTNPASGVRVVAIASTDSAFAALLSGCPPGRYGNASCENCPAGTWGPVGAQTISDCILCTAGRYSNEDGSTECTPCAAGTYADMDGTDECIPCAAGKYSTEEGASSSTFCQDCAAGKFSSANGADSEKFCKNCDGGTYSEVKGATSSNACTSCRSGTTSNPGSDSSDDCHNVDASFALGFLFMLLVVVLALIYICRGRARRMAFVVQHTTAMTTARTCNEVAATLMTTMKRQPNRDVLWRVFVVFIIVTVLFLTSMTLFLTNCFLMSRTFFVTPSWLEKFTDDIREFVHAFPVAWLVGLFAPVADFFAKLDFGELFATVNVSCKGAQAPAVLTADVLIVIGTVMVIDSQFHTVLALVFAPTTLLIRDRLTALPTDNVCEKMWNLMRIVAIVMVSSAVGSSSRYVMQLFATVVQYGEFLPSHEISEQCDDNRIDTTLASFSTVLFYLLAIPVLLLMIRVLMPSLPQPLPFVASAAKTKAWTTNLDAFLDKINPMTWVMAGVHKMMAWELNSLNSEVSAADRQLHAEEVDTDDGRLSVMKARASFIQEAQPVTTMKAQGLNEQWKEDAAHDIPSFAELVRGIAAHGRQHVWLNICSVVHVCCWKLKLALLLACGVWTDELVEALQISETAAEYYGWTSNPTNFHEDVMAAVAPMRSMVWLLVPATIILTKIAETTNDPPVFVFTDKVTMFSPLYFETWDHADWLTRRGERLLESVTWTEGKAGSSAQSTTRPSSSSSSSSCCSKLRGLFSPEMEHRVRVCLVWYFGARLPRFIVNVCLLSLATWMAFRPSVLVLILAAAVLLPLAGAYGFRAVLDLSIMLRLLKQHPNEEYHHKSTEPVGIEKDADSSIWRRVVDSVSSICDSCPRAGNGRSRMSDDDDGYYEQWGVSGN